MEAETDGLVVPQRADVDMPVRLEDDAALADARADHAAQRPLVLRQPLERGVERLVQPGARRAGIDMDDDVVALAVEHELRLAGPPRFREVGVQQEEAVEGAALLRARVVDLAAPGLVAVAAPDIDRLHQLGDADDLAAQCAGAAGFAGGGLGEVGHQDYVALVADSGANSAAVGLLDADRVGERHAGRPPPMTLIPSSERDEMSRIIGFPQGLVPKNQLSVEESKGNLSEVGSLRYRMLVSLQDCGASDERAQRDH